MMGCIVRLDNVEHHDLKVKTDHGVASGDKINQALVFPSEFFQLQREYPIFFRKGDDGSLQSVALLGLDRDENLFLDETGWQARYIPAVQARGPFVIGQPVPGPDGQAREPVIQFDADDPRLSRDEGEALFLPHGGHAPRLEHVVNVLRTIYDGLALAKSFFPALVALELIEPVTVDVRLDDNQVYTIPDLYSISQERFDALAGDALARLHQDGFLGLCFAVLFSLGNTRRLIELKHQKQGHVVG